MLFGIIDILFSCTPHFFTSKTMVHHNRASWSHYYLLPAVGTELVPHCLRWFSLNHQKHEGIGEETTQGKFSL